MNIQEILEYLLLLSLSVERKNNNSKIFSFYNKMKIILLIVNIFDDSDKIVKEKKLDNNFRLNTDKQKI